MQKFRVDVIRKEKFEVEVTAEDVTHAEDIVNTALGNMDDVAGTVVARDFDQFPAFNAGDFLTNVGRHAGSWAEVAYTHDME